jgi:hypothetical protein
MAFSGILAHAAELLAMVEQQETEADDRNQREDAGSLQRGLKPRPTIVRIGAGTASRTGQSRRAR